MPVYDPENFTHLSERERLREMARKGDGKEAVQYEPKGPTAETVRLAEKGMACDNEKISRIQKELNDSANARQESPEIPSDLPEPSAKEAVADKKGAEAPKAGFWGRMKRRWFGNGDYSEMPTADSSVVTKAIDQAENPVVFEADHQPDKKEAPDEETVRKAQGMIDNMGYGGRTDMRVLIANMKQKGSSNSKLAAALGRELSLLDQARSEVNDAIMDRKKMKELADMIACPLSEKDADLRISRIKEMMGSGNGKRVFDLLAEKNAVLPYEDIRRLLPESCNNNLRIGERNQLLFYASRAGHADQVLERLSFAAIDLLDQAGRLDAESWKSMKGIGLSKGVAGRVAGYFMKKCQELADSKGDDPAYYNRFREAVIDGLTGIG